MMSSPAAEPSALSLLLLLAAGLLTFLAGVLAAMLERSGPIRIRHWVQSAGGALSRLHDRPERFEAFRLLLSLLAKLAPFVLFWVSWRLVESLIPGRGGVGAILSVLVVLVLTEYLSRFFVGRDPERVLAALTWLYHLLNVLLMPLIIALSILLPEAAVSRREEDG